MFRVEVFLALLLIGLLLSELIRNLLRAAHLMLITFSIDPNTASLLVVFLSVTLTLSILFFCCLYPQINYFLHPTPYLDRVRRFNLFRKKVTLRWPSDWVASNTKSVVFSFSDSAQEEDILVKVWKDSEVLTTTEVWQEDNKSVEIIFPARQAGRYRFLMTYSGKPVRGSPWERIVIPGPPSPQHSKLVGIRSQTVVLRSGSTFTVQLELQDCFENQVCGTRADTDQVSVDLSTEVFLEIEPSPIAHHLDIRLSFPTTLFGAFPVSIKYQNHILGSLQLLVLTQTRLQAVNAYLGKLGFGFGVGSPVSSAYFEAQLTKLSGSEQSKPRTVYVYLTDKQVIIREFFLKLIPHRLVSFKLSPQVKLQLSEDQVLSILQHDAQESTTCLTGPEVLQLAATYYTILLRRSGGSETFGEKRAFFWNQLVKHHEDLNHRHNRLAVNIDRYNIWESTYKASRHFLQSDWARLWEIFFQGEPGVDQGGLRREWFDLVTKFIFDPENQMFIPMEEDSRSVGPNPFPPAHIKGKHYRLAGKLVGKALYETAQGDTYRLQLNARLAQSLLAQMIGVGVHFTMLEVDAPELWRTKIKFILENEVEGLDLTFIQEEVRPGSPDLVTEELISNGAKVKVTEENKKSYITALAQYLLGARVKWQVTAFLEGLHTLVPDHLLSVWDEQELELLLCGVRDYSISELRKHHTIVGVPVGRFGIVLDWFWQVLTHMSQEDLTRFVQFSTGSALLPPGGFAALRPILQISWGGAVRGSLPTSHTCFNLVVLPDSESYQELERVVLTAVREGSEGFMMA